MPTKVTEKASNTREKREYKSHANDSYVLRKVAKAQEYVQKAGFPKTEKK